MALYSWDKWVELTVGGGLWGEICGLGEKAATPQILGVLEIALRDSNRDMRAR